MYLIDTNVLINAFSGKNPDLSFLKKSVKDKTIKISVITISEFLVKAAKKDKEVLDELLKISPPLPIDLHTAVEAASLRKKHPRKSRAKLLDYLIAAQAKVHNLTLVTNNKSDFPMKDIKIVSP